MKTVTNIKQRSAIPRPVIRSIAGTLLGCSLLSPGVVTQLGHAAEPFTDQRQLGTKYSPLEQITRENVANLEVAWEYHTGELSTSSTSLDAFQDEPTLVEGNLVVCTTSRRLIALDPETGTERWVFDPEGTGSGMKKCRGISAWRDDRAPENASCRTRISSGQQIID